MGYKYDVYIGYSRKDIDYARAILKVLEKHGYTCFKNVDEVSHGAYYYDIIAESLDACRLFLFLSSESSNNSEWVLKEIAVALQKRKTLLPVVIDNSTFEGLLKTHLSNIIPLNLQGKRKNVVAKSVLESVEGLLGKKTTYKYRLIRKLKSLFNSENENNEDLIRLYSPHKVDFDIFISYRRIDGRDVARNIQQALKARGFKKIFFDYDSIQKGEFTKRIIDAIYSCEDFILVLSPKSMKRCTKKGDPVANEIRTAVKYCKNIIPVTIDGKEVKWPRSFPDDLKFIKGLQFHDHKSDAYFDHSIDELCEKLSFIKHCVESPTECISSSFVVQGQSEIIRENSNKDFDFCLCYSKHNSSDIRIICSMFENVGCRFWTIDNAIKDVGRSAQVSIGEGIIKSRYFLFFHSEYTNKSHLAIAQLQYAIDYGAKILSIKLDQTAYSYELKTLLGTYQTIELAEVGSIEKLVTTIKEIAVES